MSDRGRSTRPHVVLHVINSLGISGGAEQQLVSNVRRFRDSSLEHHIAYFSEDGHEDRAEAATAARTSIHPLFSPGSKQSRLRMISRLDRFVRDLQPSLIHSSLADASLAARIVGWRQRIPVVESLVNIAHDPIRLIDNPHVKPWKLYAHRGVDRITMRRVKAFHALSSVVAQSWHESVGIGFDRIRVIPRGVDAADLYAQAAVGPTRQDLAEEFLFDQRAKILLSVGRLEPQKGQRYLIEAMPDILTTEPDTVLLIAGRPGNASDSLAETAGSLGVDSAIRFMGRRTDVAALVQAADVFVFPSLYEGLGVSLLEALALGAAVATSDVQPLNDVVVDGHNGRLFEPRSPTDIASVVLDLLSDSVQRKRLGEAGQATIDETFTAEVAASKLEQLYRDVLETAE